MDSSSPYSQRQLFASGQLPPPSALSNLAAFGRSNTLPPLANLSAAAAARYPPPTYSHPSLSTAATAPSLSSSTLPWPTQHRTSSSRDELISPPLSLRRSDSRGKLVDRDDRADPHHHSHDHHASPTSVSQSQSQPSSASVSATVKHEGENDMPSTSDFVKKLYK